MLRFIQMGLMVEEKKKRKRKEKEREAAFLIVLMK
jgi:hypothetical protein